MMMERKIREDLPTGKTQRPICRFGVPRLLYLGEDVPFLVPFLTRMDEPHPFTINIRD